MPETRANDSNFFLVGKPIEKFAHRYPNKREVMQRLMFETNRYRKTRMTVGQAASVVASELIVLYPDQNQKSVRSERECRIN